MKKVTMETNEMNMMREVVGLFSNDVTESGEGLENIFRLSIEKPQRV